MQASSVTKSETRLPRAVQRQLEALKKYESQATAPEGEEVAAPSVEPGDAALNGEETPPGTTAATTEAATPTKPPADERENDLSYWKHRFSVLQGMLNKERRDRAESEEALHSEIGRLKEAAKTATAAEVTTETDIESMFDPEQIEALGEDQCRAIARSIKAAAKQEAQALIDQTVKPIAEREGRERERANQQAQADFEAELSALVPKWREIDQDPTWLDWLAQADERTGIVRQNILTTHVQARNAAFVANVFQAWANDMKGAEPTPEPTTQRRQVLVPPVAPPHSGAAGDDSTPTQPTRGYPSAAEIKDFYKRSSLNKVSAQERTEFEARLRLGQ